MKRSGRGAIAWGALLSLSLGACAETEQVEPVSAGQIPLIVDADMGTDDIMALLYLLQRPEVSIEAITVAGTGLAHCGAGVDLALRLLALAGREGVPVACGREAPLQGDHAFPDEWRQRADEGSGATLPEPAGAPAPEPAAELLASALRGAPRAATVLALGPLTNLGEALTADPSLADRIAKIYAMGGAVSVPGNIAYPGGPIDNEVAEWNIYVDPYAAKIVLETASLALVPLDATNHAPITMSFYDRVAADRATPHAEVVYQVLVDIEEAIQEGVYYFWDPLTAAALVEEGLIPFEPRDLDVITAEGPESGRTLVVQGGAPAEVGVGADAARFEAAFLDAINGRDR